MKKQIAGILTGLLVCGSLFAGCGKNEATQAVQESTETEKEGNGGTTDTEEKNEDKDSKEQEKESDRSATESDSEDENVPVTQESEVILDKVGVLLPEEGTDTNSSLERTELKSRLEENGYDAALYFAGEDADTQISQIRELLQDENLKALVISPVDPYSLKEVLEEVSDASVPMIDYDDLIMDTDKIKYYVTFNSRSIGNEIGKSIIKKEELDKVRDAKESRTIEFLMGSPDDDFSLFLFNGIMEELQEYIDDGTLECRSGRLIYDENSIMRKNTDTAVKQLQSLIDEFYASEKTPDIICTASDDFALAMLELLEEEGINPEDENWPFITGVNADAEAVKCIAQGKIGFTVMMDRRDLAEACVTLVDTYLKGDDVEVSNYSQYDNGVKIIGTVTCDGEIIDKDNYQILVDNGFYLSEMIAPAVSGTPDISQTPGVSGTPDISQTPGVSSTPDISQTPEGSGTPQISPAPKENGTSDINSAQNGASGNKTEPEITTEEVPPVKDQNNQSASKDQKA